jgi:hypothetical protein
VGVGDADDEAAERGEQGVVGVAIDDALGQRRRPRDGWGGSVRAGRGARLSSGLAALPGAAAGLSARSLIACTSMSTSGPMGPAPIAWTKALVTPTPTSVVALPRRSTRSRTRGVLSTTVITAATSKPARPGEKPAIRSPTAEQDADASAPRIDGLRSSGSMSAG